MKLIPLNGDIAWKAIAFHVLQNHNFRSVTNITYEARLVNDIIFYKGGNRNNGEEEELTKNEFVEGFNSVKDLKEINTNTIKDLIPTTIYRKRTPFIGLLYSAGIIE